MKDPENWGTVPITTDRLKDVLRLRLQDHRAISEMAGASKMTRAKYRVRADECAYILGLLNI